MDGVPRRFPQLQFAFLEGGAGWGANLYSDALSHWKKRNRDMIHEYDPVNLDRALIRDLFERYGSEKVTRDESAIEESLEILNDREGNPAGLDEFARCGVERAEDIRDIFAGQFHFGCEADDPMNSVAFNKRLNPFGVELSAIFGSDIGHWDVPDTREVLGEAFELVEKELVTEENFRSFVFENPVRLFTRTNPNFFKDTILESKVGVVRR
jgi:hypothetical protein